MGSLHRLRHAVAAELSRPTLKLAHTRPINTEVRQDSFGQTSTPKLTHRRILLVADGGRCPFGRARLSTGRHMLSKWARRKLWRRPHDGLDRPPFHALLTGGRLKQSASSWFCSRTVHAPAKPKPLRSHSIASKPWIVRRAVWKA